MNPRVPDTTGWQYAFLERVQPLARRWRRQRLGARMLRTLWVPLAVILVLMLVQRWTLIELPEPDVLLLLPVPLWALGMGVWWLLDRPKPRQLAHVADRVLGLDERLATALAGLDQPWPAERGVAELVRRQRDDALTVLAYAGDRMVRTFPFVPGRHLRPLSVATGVSLLLLPAMFLPSAVEPLRAEQAAVRAIVLDQAADLEQTRREAVARPQLPPALSALLDQELGGAASRLRDAPTDRASALAALTGAEDRLRQELPDNFQEQLTARSRAARDLAAALPADARPDPPPAGTTELQAAALNAEALADVAAELLGNPDQGNSVLGAAGSLERAAAALTDTDRDLANNLRAAASGLRNGDAEVAQEALTAVAAGMRAADSDQISMQTLADAVAQLGQGRSAVAAAGRQTAGPGAPGAGRPSFGRQDQTGPAGAAGAAGATGAAGAAGTGQNGAAGGEGSSPPGSGPGAPGSGGTAPGTGDSNGSSAPITGGGGQGTGDSGGNQAGTGVGTAPPPSGPNDPAAPPEQVYVPDPSGTRPSETGGGEQASVPGQGTGGTGTDSPVVRQGPGQNPGIYTPYQDVIGTYQDQAAQALDRSALPPDAQQYIRDYFSSLGP